MVGQIAAGSIAGSGTWSKVATNPGDPNAPKQTRYGLAGTVIPPVGNVSGNHFSDATLINVGVTIDGSERDIGCLWRL